MSIQPSFRAVTYNVLAQAYVRPDRYRGVSTEALSASARRERVCTRIARLAPDLLCAQEVEPEVFTQLRAVLPEHRAHYAQRVGRPEGVATFVRAASFEVESERVLQYAGDDHLALLLRLRTSGGRALLLANTHLRWQPADTPLEEHRGVSQIEALLSDLSTHEADFAWLLAGDLNATSRSPVLDRARAAGLDLAARSLRPWDTALINGRRRKLDYLLHDPAVLGARPHPLPELQRARPIPSMHEPSDHLPLQVDFAWC